MIEMRNVTVYIGHPLADNFKENYEDYLQCVAEAGAAGFTVISWAHYCETHLRFGMPPEHKGSKHDYYLPHDFNLIEAADLVWFIGDFSRSEGMRAEVEHARQRGKRISGFASKHEFLSWIKRT